MLSPPQKVLTLSCFFSSSSKTQKSSLLAQWLAPLFIRGLVHKKSPEYDSLLIRNPSQESGISINIQTAPGPSTSLYIQLWGDLITSSGLYGHTHTHCCFINMDLVWLYTGIVIFLSLFLLLWILKKYFRSFECVFIWILSLFFLVLWRIKWNFDGHYIQYGNVTWPQTLVGPRL